MSCGADFCLDNPEHIESLKLIKSESSSEVLGGRERMIKLERGGWLIQTEIGNIQYGIPPETVKDSLNLGLTVPTYYILPANRFDRRFGMNVAEFEFPSYFNFFVLKRKIVLICDEAAKAAIQKVFQETLLGPKEFPNFASEFHYSYDQTMIPDLAKELAHFGRNPFNRSEPLTTDLLVSFALFDQNNEIVIENKVTIKRCSDGTISFSENGQKIAEIKDKMKIRDKRYDEFVKDNQNKTVILYSNINQSAETLQLQPKNIAPDFIPPAFGITVLGVSHGFDPKGSTSGYVIWINKRGVMVDPPPFSSYMLKKHGIPYNLIDKVIITHCHADHDAGSFQKVLFASQVEIITTKTIMGSFLRKYSALTTYGEDELADLFQFHPITIGYPINVNGGHFNFFYSFHTIPCIGFEVEYQGKSIYFSGDTFYDPEALKKLQENGVLSEGRVKSLAEKDWKKYSVILHEGGVPPIHTPMSVLTNFSPEIKEKLYLVHVAEKDVPPNSGLKVAKCGLENTIILQTETSETDQLFDKLDLIASIDIFEELPLKKARDFMRCSTIEYYKPGEYIIKEGTIGDKFYIVSRGTIKIFNSSFEKFGFTGDYFGESALSSNNPRNANVIAFTEASVLSINRIDFIFIMGEKKLVNQFLNLSKIRKNPINLTINKNVYLSKINEAQKTLLQMIMKEVSFAENEVIWKKGSEATKSYLILSGEVVYQEGPEEILYNTLKAGVLVGEFPALIKKDKTTTTLVSTEKTVAYQIVREDLLNVLARVPGLMMAFHDTFYIEQKN